MKDFFVGRFEHDYYLTKTCIDFFELNEDCVTPFVKKSICHLLNIHHIWNCRLQHVVPESEPWDQFPVHDLEKLHRNNFLTTIDILETIDSSDKQHTDAIIPRGMDKETQEILFHMLQHANYHRAQIILELRLKQLPFPIFNLI
jgi:uncharacterized damage-inducible protein DinB